MIWFIVYQAVESAIACRAKRPMTPTSREFVCGESFAERVPINVYATSDPFLIGKVPHIATSQSVARQRPLPRGTT